MDLARRGEADSRDPTLAAVWQGLDPLFGLDPPFCLRCIAVSKVGPKKKTCGQNLLEFCAQVGYS